MPDVRPSPIAGQWYPADPRRLAQEVERYIQAAHLPEIPGRVLGIISPHAGHRYSGPVAGYAFAALEGLTPDIVAVVSPMHYPYPAAVITSAHSAYATPLGEIPVDRTAQKALDDALRQRVSVGLTAVKNDPEHALEIELPFLQSVLKKPFRLLPVMLRDQGVEVVSALGLALAEVLQGQAALLVASSDLSHFYSQEIAETLDRRFLQKVAAFDPRDVIEIEERGEAFACGRGAVAAVMWAAQALGANHAQILQYATSGAITQDFDQVVGYAAAVLTQT